MKQYHKEQLKQIRSKLVAKTVVIKSTKFQDTKLILYQSKELQEKIAKKRALILEYTNISKQNKPKKKPKKPKKKSTLVDTVID